MFTYIMYIYVRAKAVQHAQIHDPPLKIKDR